MSTETAAVGEQVYATLLLSDSYLPGALVLAHSLRDTGTKEKLAVLVTLDSVSADAITQLKTVYDYVLPVPRIRNEHPANLYLMNRADLHSAFTKINLWKQTQFAKIVYIDADVVAYRAPDELFGLPHAFSAAPDIGWPDLVNTGVMALTPNMGDYYAMLAMAERGISFDGADQGLINMHFKHSVNRLSFTYNVTPSAHYQYIPAYRHFQSSISMVHFIGSNKPWFSGRNASRGNAPIDEMVGRWWAVYDRHFRAEETSSSGSYPQRYPPPSVFSPTKKTQSQSGDDNPARHSETSSENKTDTAYATSSAHSSQSTVFAGSNTGTAAKPTVEHHDNGHVAVVEENAMSKKQSPPPVIMNSWDAQRHPPPPDSKPEAINFPSTHYEMSQDVNPFVPPVRYPSPPKNMWYDVPAEPPAAPVNRPPQIFPWERHQPTPSRSFTSPDGNEMPGSPQRGAPEDKSEQPPPAGDSDGDSALATSELSCSGATSEKSRPSDSGISSIGAGGAWGSFSRANAWDEVPEIGRYVEGLQKHRRARSRIATASSAGAKLFTEDTLPIPRTLRVTDFPTEVERPSLPVTPAPIRRPSFWGDDDKNPASAEDAHLLPAAEGVPSQSEWDPAAQLQLLAQYQSEGLLRKLSGDAGVPGRRSSEDIPSRSLPFGSEALQSPNVAMQSPPANVLSPQPVRGKPSAANIVQSLSRSDSPSPELTAAQSADV